MATKEEKLNFYKVEIKKYVSSVNVGLLSGIVDFLGPSLFQSDGELVASKDKSELETIKKKFLVKKLGLVEEGDNFNNALDFVTEKMGSSNPKKYRAIYYYFLVKKFKKEELFIK